jgi:hypothetical protein
MKIFCLLIVVVLGSVGCGGSISCDFVASGLCVNVGDNTDIETYMISTEIEFIRDGLDLYFPEKHQNLAQLLEDSGVSMEYTKPGDSRLAGAKGDFSFENNEIFVEHGTCNQNLNILGHEILHFVAKEYLGVDDDSNRAHNVERLFMGHGGRETVEYFIYKSTNSFCAAE